MRVDVVIDIVCPWCYVGWARLQQFMEAHRDIQVVVHPFLLDANMPPGGRNRKSYMAAKFGADADMSRSAKAIESEMPNLVFNWGQIERVPDTVPAHYLIARAGDQSAAAQADIIHALFAAYFTHGRDIGAGDVLADIATAADIKFSLDQDLRAAADVHIRRADMGIRGMGIAAVPTYIFDKSIVLTGAQPLAALEQAAAQAARQARE